MGPFSNYASEAHMCELSILTFAYLFSSTEIKILVVVMLQLIWLYIYN